MGAKDLRLKMMNEILNGIKVLLCHVCISEISDVIGSVAQWLSYWTSGVSGLALKELSHGIFSYFEH